MIPSLSYEEFKAMKPCADDFRRVTKLFGGAKKWRGVKITAAQARKAGATFDDVVWVACAVADINPDVKRRLRLWLADCDARVLHIDNRDYSPDWQLDRLIEWLSDPEPVAWTS
jgi:hypothetical protein